jgi:hypothetical protein
MKAIVWTKYGPQEDLQLKDVEKPAPKDDEALIKVHAASVNLRYWGQIRANPFFIRLMAGGLLKPKNTILGADLNGQVEAVSRSPGAMVGTAARLSGGLEPVGLYTRYCWFLSLFQKPVDDAWPRRSPIESGFPCLYYLHGLSFDDDPMDWRVFSSGCTGTNPKLDLQTRIGLLSSPISHRVDFG